MNQLEKISYIVGLIVVGVGISSHSVSLQRNVETLSVNYQKNSLEIEKNGDNILELKSYYGQINEKINNNKSLITSLRNAIDKQQDRLINSMEKTQQLLTEISKK